MGYSTRKHDLGDMSGEYTNEVQTADQPCEP